MSGPTARVGGRHFRVADPSWDDPLDGSYARARGGRWNSPGGYPVVYLNCSPATARLNCLEKLRGLPYGPEDLEDVEAPELVSTDVPTVECADCLSTRGLDGWGLPPSYPTHPDGRRVTWDACRSVGEAAHRDGLRGVACRSAAHGAGADDRELAYFPLEDAPELAVVERMPFGDWFWDA